MNTRLLSILLVLPSIAHAHPGHGSGDFGSGFVHPLQGMDHLIAMIAVGLWAAQLGGASRWTLPLSFAGAMAAGLACGPGGRSFAGTEVCIAISLVILGGMVAAAGRLRPGTAAILAGTCAFFHGLAHGLDAPSTGATGFITGLFVSTGLIQAAAVLGGSALICAGRHFPLRVAGAAVCVAGIWQAAWQ